MEKIDPEYIKAKARFGQTRVLCPSCTPSRKTKNDATLSIKQDETGTVWRCWHCSIQGSMGNERLSLVQNPAQPKPVVPIKVITGDPVNEGGLEYLLARGISAETCEAAGLMSGQKFFKKVGEVEAVGFPYHHQDRLTAVKWRSLSGKEFTQEGSAQTLFMADRLPIGSDIIVTEGELDALSFWEVGIPAVSIPSGALSEGTADDAARLKWLSHHDELIQKAQNVYLAVDMDGPGQTTANELARRIGKLKCWRISFPGDCKDANDTLVKVGRDALLKARSLASRWPVEGLASPVDFMDKVVSLYNNGLPRGTSTGWQNVDEIFTLNPGNLVIVTGTPGSGKALSLDTKILTSTGWKTMGTIQEGDKVFAPDGTMTTVTKAFDVMHDRPCYEVFFKDGMKVVADADHLWVTRCEKARMSEINSKKKRAGRKETHVQGTDQRHKRTFPSSKTTQEIADTLITKSGRFNHAVSNIRPLVGGAWTFPVPPYTLGAWLGDGTSSDGSLTSPDEEVVEYIREDGYTVTKHSKAYGWGILGLAAQLRDAGLKNNKYIPEECFSADIPYRLALLQGLMDSDGYPEGAGTSEFTSVRKTLADGVFRLMASLGLRPKMHEGRAMLNGKDCGPKYRVYCANLLPVFRLNRKANKTEVTNRSREWHSWQQIVEVNPVQSVPVRCITVDHPSHEFLITDGLIPTHNSQAIDNMLVNAMIQNDWRVAYASFENPPELHLAKLISLKTGKPFGTGPTPRIGQDEMMEALGWINERVTFLTNDGVMPTVESLIERFEAAVRRSGIKAVVVDPFNFIKLNGKKDGGMDTESINEMLAQFKTFALRAEVTFFLIAHPAKPMNQGPDWVPTGYSIASSAHFYNRADFGLTMQRKANENIFHVWKCRFPWQGQIGTASLNYDKATGRFREAVTTGPDQDDGVFLRGYDEDHPY